MTEAQHIQAILRLGDDALVLGQRLSAWCGHGPILEEDIACPTWRSTSLVRRNFYPRGGPRKRWARRRPTGLLPHRPRISKSPAARIAQRSFWDTIVRHMFFSAFALERYAFLTRQLFDAEVAGIAAKAVKELQYHWEHAAKWVIRLGDGTDESHEKVQTSVNDMWAYTGEFFDADDIDQAGQETGLLPDLSVLAKAWQTRVEACLSQATLTKPDATWAQKGGKQGMHTEHLSYMLAEMQVLPRTYPDATW